MVNGCPYCSGMANYYPSSRSNESSRLGRAGCDAQHAPGATEAAPAAEVRLDQRTYFDQQGHHSAKLRNFGNGLAEAGWSFVQATRASKKPRGQSEKREANEKRAQRRAQARIRHLALAAGLDHLLTLTFRENVTDFDRASRCFERFIKLVHAEMPEWAYVAVAERQKRGAWHWHLGVAGRQNVALLRRLWLECVGDGNVDVQSPPGKRGNSKLRLVSYLTKYLGKSFNELRELDAHRFRASKHIKVPCQSIAIPVSARGDISGYVVAALLDVAGTVGTVKRYEDVFAGWACSWT